MDLGINKLPWYGQVLIFVVLSALGIGAYHYFYAADREVALEAQQVELDKAHMRISKGLAIARQLPAFEAEVAQLEAQLTSLKAVLPDQRDVGEMLRRIQTLALQSSLVVKNFRPQAVKNQKMHAEWPMTLELDGTYHNLGLFLDRVSKVPRIINISNIAITSKDRTRDPAATSDGTTVSAQCVATAFVLAEKPVPAKPGVAGAKSANGK